MALTIVRGKRPGAVRAVIYGQEGVGKSTLASQIPDALIIDTEDGTGQIDAARVIALDWRAVEHAIKELIADPQGFRAVVIDTADWLEKGLIEFMLKQGGKKSIEDYGFGKGYTILQEHVVRFLALVDQLVAKGIHVVFVAHAKVTRTSPPDQTDGFDRYELKLTKQVAPLLKEWADLVLFCCYRIQIVEGSDGRLKAQGGKERVMHAIHSAAWDAKNRFGLPDEMPMEFSKIAHLFGAAAPRSNAKPVAQVAPVATTKVETEAAVEAAVVADPGPQFLALPEHVKAIAKFRGRPIADAMIDEALAYCEAIDLEELKDHVAEKLLYALQRLDKEVPTPTAKPAAPVLNLPANVRTWLEANETQANAYLASVRWLAAGQTWRDLEQGKADSIVDRWTKFQGAALNHKTKAAA